MSSITEGQKKQYKRFVEDAADRAWEKIQKLDKEEFQRFIEKGDEFSDDIVASVTRLSISNQFANEEVASKYGYLSGYKPGAKSITEQTNRLRELISGIGYADEKLVEQPLPENAEGYFAIPRWQTVSPTYGEAVQKVFDLLKKTRGGRFINYREGKLGSNYLRLTKKTADAFEACGKEQEGYDILVIPAQFGLRHAGRSVRRAREVMPGREFGLDPFTIGIMLLTHPERLIDYDDLWIDCAGAEYSPDGAGVFSRAPGFDFGDGYTKFDTYGVSIVSGHYGSFSGFRPQADACPLEN
ncbi:MAG: hypothetical protein WC523_05450 [Patescibacteria group bacterium]